MLLYEFLFINTKILCYFRKFRIIIIVYDKILCKIFFSNFVF